MRRNDVSPIDMQRASEFALEKCPELAEEIEKLQRSIHDDVAKEVEKERVKKFGTFAGAILLYRGGIPHLSIPILGLRFARAYEFRFSFDHVVGHLRVYIEHQSVDVPTNLATTCRELVLLIREGERYLSLPMSYFARTPNVTMYVLRRGNVSLLIVMPDE